VPGTRETVNTGPKQPRPLADPEQQERYRGRIEAGKKLRELVNELERAGALSVERVEEWGGNRRLRSTAREVGR
jgi:hypothetical protein